MNRHLRFACLASLTVSALALGSTGALGAPGSTTAVPTAGACALVKGTPTADNKPTFDLKLSGFGGGARVIISDGTHRQEVRVASNGKFVDDDVKFATYQVKQKHGGASVQCTSVAKEDTTKPDATKPVDVTSASARYLGKTGDVPCIIVSGGLVPAFGGTITAAGPGTVKYRWVRSDGSVSGVLPLTFTEAGTKDVPLMRWDGVALQGTDKFSGSAQITIVGDDTKSNRAEVTLNCVIPK
ncbi:hypothetical protein [Streptomyces sp. NBC_01006]|uniref:hypothetical protein n=1 Tax=Streptomyces sp. NBC_01006 TaxID=2903716 RepID=UPI00386D27F6|nr:hypothetical protein OG509_23780 [Streptomyces sp. NBC_01006]